MLEDKIVAGGFPIGSFRFSILGRMEYMAPQSKWFQAQPRTNFVRRNVSLGIGISYEFVRMPYEVYRRLGQKEITLEILVENIKDGIVTVSMALENEAIQFVLSSKKIIDICGCEIVIVDIFTDEIIVDLPHSDSGDLIALSFI